MEKLEDKQENKAVFLDRDGTIIIDHIYLNDPNRIDVFEESYPALELLHQKGVPLYSLSPIKVVWLAGSFKKRKRQENQRNHYQSFQRQKQCHHGRHTIAPITWTAVVFVENPTRVCSSRRHKLINVNLRKVLDGGGTACLTWKREGVAGREVFCFKIKQLLPWMPYTRNQNSYAVMFLTPQNL